MHIALMGGLAKGGVGNAPKDGARSKSAKWLWIAFGDGSAYQSAMFNFVGGVIWRVNDDPSWGRRKAAALCAVIDTSNHPMKIVSSFCERKEFTKSDPRRKFCCVGRP